VRDLVEIFEQLRQRDPFEFATLENAVALVAFVAQIAARLNVAGRFAQKRNREALAHRFIVDAKGGGIQDFDAVSGIVCVEDRDREIIAVYDFDRSDHKRILGGKEFMTALIARGDLVKHTMTHEAAQNLAQGRNRGERFRAVSARVDDLQAVGFRPLEKDSTLPAPAVGCRKVGRATLAERQEEPFAFAC
jgi:hypothetical protein